MRLPPVRLLLLAMTVVHVGTWATEAAAQPPVRVARPAALTSPLRDDDLAWITPLMAAQGADQRRGNRQMTAAANTLTAHASDDVGAARVARIRAGTLDPLHELRRGTPHAVAPASARLDARCSAALTESTGGLQTKAAYTVPDLEAAQAFYHARGWRVLGGARSGYVLLSPDRSVEGALGGTAVAFRQIAADVERQGLQGYDHVKACTGIPDGRALVLWGEVHAESRAREAYAAAGASTPARLPDALARAGLTSAQWDATWAVIAQAQIDEMLVSQPGALERDAGSAAEVARRRANVAWYQRNRAAVDAATRLAGGDS